MSQKTIIAALAGILIIAGGAAAYLLLNDDKETTNTNNQNQTVVAEDKTINGSIASLLGLNTARKCTYSDDTSSGTVYTTNDKRMRIDFVSSEAEDTNGSMIITSGRQHFWSNDKKEGVIMNFTAEQEGDTTSEESDQSVDMNHEYTLDCSSWKVDEALLTPPADVNFVDMAALMHEHMQQ